MVKSLRAQCIELLTEIEARLDFEDELPPLDINEVVTKINTMSEDVESALETANYDKLLQSGLQVNFWFFVQANNVVYVFQDSSFLYPLLFYFIFLSMKCCR